MTEARRRVLGGLVLLVAALGLSMLPGALPGAMAGAVLALFLPGYALLQCLGTPVRTDRWLGLMECIAASLALTPLALRLAGLLLPFDRRHVLGELAVVTLGLLALGALRPRAPATRSCRRTPPAVLAIVATTILLLAPSLAVGPTPEGGETRVKGWDLNNHLAIAESVASRGLPPLNPFLASEAPFYYHAYLHILLGAVLVVAGEGAHAYLLIALLTLLLAAVFLFTCYRVVSELTGDDRVALLSLPIVSLVGGFDLVPMLARAFLERDRIGSAAEFFLRRWNVDGWVSNRGMLVPSLFATFYWSPHAIAAVVVFLMALLYLRRSDADIASVVAAGVCLASMAGYNGYVSVGGAATLVLIGAVDLKRFLGPGYRAGRGLLARAALAGGVAAILAFPVLELYTGQRKDIDKFRWVRPSWTTPLQIILEFGPALVLGLAGLAIGRRRENRTIGLLPFLSMLAVSLPALCCLASTGENNDLAMRLSIFSWIGLAVLSGFALNRTFPAPPAPARSSWKIRAAALAALSLGGLSVVWFAAGAAVNKPTLPADEVATGRWVRSHVPPGGLVQGSPLRDNPELVFLTGHPAVLSDTWAATLFYSEPDEVSRRMASLSQAFSNPDPAAACASLRSLHIAALVVGPPEERDYPLLGRADAWPCLAETHDQGAYRVYRMRP